MVAWLVAMGILSDEAGDICLSRFQFECEQRIKLVQERFLAAKEIDESRNIMLHMPSILPGISFGIVTTGTFGVCHLTGVERSLPSSVRITRTHKLGFRIKQILVEIRTFGEVSRIFCLAHTFSHVCGCIIVVYRFEGRRNRFGLNQISGEVTVFHVRFPIGFLFVRYGLGLLDGVESAFGIKSAEPFAVGFGYDGYTVVAYHGIGFLAPQSPDGQEALHFALLYQ